MSLLAELQRDFCDALRTTDAPDPTLLNLLSDDALALQRFQVYRNNFIVLNGDAIAAMYPVIKRLVGDDAFRLLASSYVRRYPPMERTLLLYGDSFPDYLASIAELSALPYLADVARLEFAWTSAYHAVDAAGLAPEQMAALDNSEMAAVRLTPHPSMQLIASDYPLYRIWVSNQPDSLEQQVSLDEGSSRLIVIRPRLEVEVREVDAAEFIFMEHLSANATVAEAYESAVQVDSEFDLSSLFQRHLLDGTFCSLSGQCPLPTNHGAHI